MKQAAQASLAQPFVLEQQLLGTKWDVVTHNGKGFSLMELAT